MSFNKVVKTGVFFHLLLTKNYSTKSWVELWVLCAELSEYCKGDSDDDDDWVSGGSGSHRKNTTFSPSYLLVYKFMVHLTFFSVFSENACTTKKHTGLCRIFFIFSSVQQSNFFFPFHHLVFFFWWHTWELVCFVGKLLMVSGKIGKRNFYFHFCRKLCACIFWEDRKES